MEIKKSNKTGNMSLTKAGPLHKSKENNDEDFVQSPVDLPTKIESPENLSFLIRLENVEKQISETRKENYRLKSRVEVLEMENSELMICTT